jgi:hypothetical protein
VARCDRLRGRRVNRVDLVFDDDVLIPICSHAREAVVVVEGARWRDADRVANIGKLYVRATGGGEGGYPPSLPRPALCGVVAAGRGRVATTSRVSRDSLPHAALVCERAWRLWG